MVIDRITIETIIGPIIEIDQEEDGTTIGQVIGAIIMSNKYETKLQTKCPMDF